MCALYNNYTQLTNYYNSVYKIIKIRGKYHFDVLSCSSSGISFHLCIAYCGKKEFANAFVLQIGFKLECYLCSLN